MDDAPDLSPSRSQSASEHAAGVTFLRVELRPAGASLQVISILSALPSAQVWGECILTETECDQRELALKGEESVKASCVVMSMSDEVTTDV